MDSSSIRDVAHSASVSVVVPVYNGASYLAESLDSALSQTVRPLEILVFDNGSTDGSIEVAKSRLPDTAIFTSEVNLGAVANFNRAARQARGDHLLWLAADDRLTPEHLETCLGVLAGDPAAPGCLPGIRFIDPEGAPLREQRDLELSSKDPRIRLRSFLRRDRWTEFYCLYRRDALLSSPMVTNEYGADVLLTWWLLLRGHLAVAGEPLLEYREYPTKSVSEMATALDPNAPTRHWRKVRLWLRLRAMSYEADVDDETSRTARRELVLCLAHRSWLNHLAEDLMLRWPVIGRLARAARAVSLWAYPRSGRASR